MEETQVCKECHKEKRLDEFYRKKNLEYTDKICKKCRSDKQKLSRVKNIKKRQVSSDINKDNLIYKTCTGCEEKKELDEFGIKVSKGKYVGRRERCRACEKFERQQKEIMRQEEREKQKQVDREMLLAMSYQERKNFTERRILKSRLKWFYGIPIEKYDEMLKQQGGLCAICHNPPEQYQPLAVDHDHLTGYVRGLLCSSCNWGLGHFRDSQTNLANAIKYLQDSVWQCD